MKTYNQYLKIIRDREAKEERKRYEAHKSWCKMHEEGYDKQSGICSYGHDSNVGKMTFDYSVEIVGMMLQDFLDELPLPNSK